MKNKKIFSSYLFIVTNICLISLLFFTFLNFFQGDTTIAYVELGLTSLLFLSSISMLLFENVSIATTIAIIVIMALSINNIITGGFNNTGIFWIYIIPMSTFYIIKSKYAAMVTFSFIAFMFITGLMQSQNYVEVPYPSITLYIAGLSLIFTTVLTIIYKRISDLNFERIENLVVEKDFFNSILELNSTYKDLETFTNQIIAKVVEYFKFDAGLLHLHTIGDDFLHPVGSYNVDEDLAMKAGHFNFSDAEYPSTLQDLKPTYIVDFEKVDPVKAKLTKRKSIVMIPLISHGELSGSITLGSNHRRVLSETEKKLLERIGSQVSLILEDVKEDEIIVEKLI